MRVDGVNAGYPLVVASIVQTSNGFTSCGRDDGR